MRVEDDKRVKGRGGGLGDRAGVVGVERGFELASADYSRRSSPETNVRKIRALLDLDGHCLCILLAYNVTIEIIRQLYCRRWLIVKTFEAC